MGEDRAIDDVNSESTCRILIVQMSSSLDGSAHSGLLLANGLRAAGWNTAVAFATAGPMVERYRAAGHETHCVHHDNWLRRNRIHQFAKDVWLEWRRSTEFQDLIRRTDADVVYLNTTVSLAGALAAHQNGVPLIWHLREMFADVGGEMHAPSWAMPLVREGITRLADRVVANSAATARNVLRDSAEEAAVVPNAVRSEFFAEPRSQSEARSELGLSIRPRMIGIPGTLRPMKGHSFFFEAVAPLLDERDDLRVVVPGGGEEQFERKLREQVRDLGIGDQVVFLGWIQDMPGFYRACDLVCIPSRAEPFGRTAIEAYAVGTPVIASAVGGLREVVRDGDTGVLVPYGNSAVFERSVRELLDSGTQREMLAERAREVAANRYHERVYKRRLVQLVDDLVGRCTGKREPSVARGTPTISLRSSSRGGLVTTPKDEA